MLGHTETPSAQGYRNIRCEFHAASVEGAEELHLRPHATRKCLRMLKTPSEVITGTAQGVLVAFRWFEAVPASRLCSSAILSAWRVCPNFPTLVLLQEWGY